MIKYENLNYTQFCTALVRSGYTVETRAVGGGSYGVKLSKDGAEYVFSNPDAKAALVAAYLAFENPEVATAAPVAEAPVETAVEPEAAPVAIEASAEASAEVTGS